MSSARAFEQIFVISDLHLGGETGFQMFASTTELVALIEHVTGLPPEQHAALIINGDFIDFLAEQPHQHFDAYHATHKLQRIAVDPTFAPIFAALNALLSTDNRKLIINLGNHDLELALPHVQACLVDLLCEGNDAARGRLQLVLDGTGVRVQVGQADALILHGNEFDNFNVSDHHQLRLIARDLHYGKKIDDWKPNAGSCVVIEVMNELKQKYPFIDLLKPEIPSVFSALSMIDPGAAKKLDSFGPILLKAGWDATRMKRDVLDADASDAQDGTFVSTPISETEFLQSVLDMSECDYQHQLRSDGQLGYFSALWQKLRGKPQQEVLREALSFLAKDQSFDFANEDACYKEATKKVDANLPFLVTGHTHQLRAIKRARGAYFNSGTWARLIRIRPEDLQSEAAFDPSYQMLMAKTAAQVDQVQKATGVQAVLKLCPAVQIYCQNGKSYGRLVHFQNHKLEAIAGAQEFESAQLALTAKVGPV